MPALVCHWDDSMVFKKADFARKKLLKQWTHTCKAFDIPHLIIIGKLNSIPILGDVGVKIEYFEDYSAVRQAYPNKTYIVIVEGGADLARFTHPKECFYVLGSNYSNPKILKGDLAVGIKAKIPLWDVVAAGIVLQDRFNQWH